MAMSKKNKESQEEVEVEETKEKGHRKDSIAAFFESFEANDNKISFKLASDNVGEKIPVINTGSYSLDDALSSGGWPKGRLIQLYGPPGSGKSMLTYIAIKAAQQEDPDAIQLFIDAEQTFSPDWAAALGCDTSRILVVDSDTASNGRLCFEMLLGVPKEDAKTHEYKGQSKPGFIDKIIEKDPKFNCNLIVLDSLGAIIPPGEDVSRVGKANISLLARFLSTTFKKLSLAISKTDTPFLVINHKKDNMDPYGADHTFSGGNSYSHHLSANVYFERVGRKDANIYDENEQCIGYTIRATVEKSKFGPWPRKCEFKVITSKGIVDAHEELKELAITYGVIVRATSVTYTYKDKSFRGAEALSKALQEDVEFADAVRQDIETVRENKREQLREEQKKIRDKRLGDE